VFQQKSACVSYWSVAWNSVSVSLKVDQHLHVFILIGVTDLGSSTVFDKEQRSTFRLLHEQASQPFEQLKITNPFGTQAVICHKINIDTKLSSETILPILESYYTK